MKRLFTCTLRPAVTLLAMIAMTAAFSLGARGEEGVLSRAIETSTDPFEVVGSTEPAEMDGRWWNGFSLPVLDGRVHALIVHHGNLIAAGAFEMAGGRRVNHVARWDGHQWQPLGGGIGGEVFALAIYRDRLIAGGQYFSPYGSLASWDGRSWSPVGVPVSGGVAGIEVRALLAYGDTLIVGGRFDRVAHYPAPGKHAVDVPVSNMARWDGSAWSMLGDGLDERVDALAIHRGEIVAGGEFARSGERELEQVARWDGQAWQSLGSEIPFTGYTRVNASHWKVKLMRMSTLRAQFSDFRLRRASRPRPQLVVKMVPEVGIEPTRGVNPTGF